MTFQQKSQGRELAADHGVPLIPYGNMKKLLETQQIFFEILRIVHRE
jgi:hypothetical protein